MTSTSPFDLTSDSPKKFEPKSPDIPYEEWAKGQANTQTSPEKFEPKSPDITYEEWAKGQKNTQTDTLRPPPSGNRLKIPEVTHSARNDTPSGTPGNAIRTNDLRWEMKSLNLFPSFCETDQKTTPIKGYAYLREKSPSQAQNKTRVTPSGSEKERGVERIGEIRDHFQKKGEDFTVFSPKALRDLAEKNIKILPESYPCVYRAIVHSAANRGIPLDEKYRKNPEYLKHRVLEYIDEFKDKISQHKVETFPGMCHLHRKKNAWYNEIVEDIESDGSSESEAKLCIIGLVLKKRLIMFDICTGKIKEFTGTPPWDRTDACEGDPIYIACKNETTCLLRYSNSDKKFNLFVDDSRHILPTAPMREIDHKFSGLCQTIIEMDSSSKYTYVEEFKIFDKIGFWFKKSSLGQKFRVDIKCCQFDDCVILNISPYQNISELEIEDEIWHSRTGDVKDVILTVCRHELKGYVCEDGQTLTLTAQSDQAQAIRLLLESFKPRACY